MRARAFTYGRALYFSESHVSMPKPRVNRINSFRDLVKNVLNHVFLLHRTLQSTARAPRALKKIALVRFVLNTCTTSCVKLILIGEILKEFGCSQPPSIFNEKITFFAFYSEFTVI